MFSIFVVAFHVGLALTAFPLRRYAVKSSQHILLQEQEAAILRQVGFCTYGHCLLLAFVSCFFRKVQDHPHIVRFFFEWKNQWLACML